MGYSSKNMQQISRDVCSHTNMKRMWIESKYQEVLCIR